MIHRNISSMAWNLYEVNGDKKAYSDSLYQCMLWSRLRKDNYFEDRYKDRMLQLQSICDSYSQSHPHMSEQIRCYCWNRF